MSTTKIIHLKPLHYSTKEVDLAR